MTSEMVTLSGIQHVRGCHRRRILAATRESGLHLFVQKAYSWPGKPESVIVFRRLIVFLGLKCRTSEAVAPRGSVLPHQEPQLCPYFPF